MLVSGFHPLVLFGFPLYESQFPFILGTMIANTECESDGSNANAPGPEKKRKRGLGKGGAGAKYCTMSVAICMAQFPNEPPEELLDLQNNPIMWCLACGKPVAHQTKSYADTHLRRKCHIEGKAPLAKQEAKKEAAARQRDERVIAMQRVTAIAHGNTSVDPGPDSIHDVAAHSHPFQELPLHTMTKAALVSH